MKSIFFFNFVAHASGVLIVQFSSVQSLSHVQLFATPWAAARQASLSITNSRSLLKLIPLSWWCHPTISSSVVSSSCLQSFPASESFQVSQFFTSGGQIIGASASSWVLPMNIQSWIPSGNFLSRPLGESKVEKRWRLWTKDGPSFLTLEIIQNSFLRTRIANISVFKL